MTVSTKIGLVRASEKHLFENFKSAFAHAWPLLFSRTGLSNLLNKIPFTFEVAPCLILSLFRRLFRRCASILAQRYKGVGGWEGGGEGWVRVGVWREEAKAPQVKTQGTELPTDGPDHTTRLKGHHSSQG